MIDNIKQQRNKENKSGYFFLSFIGAAIGAVFGLITYLKDWL